MGTIMNIRRGGGATGCALEVTGVNTGDTVLLQKGDKSYTKTLDSSKKAMFRGLTGGTWTAKMSNGTQNVQREVKITDNYELTVKFFAATISVTYPAGSTCTCTFSHEGETIKTYTAPDTSGSYTFTVSNAADWVISCTNGTQTASKTVSITQDEQSESVVLIYTLYLFSETDGNVGNWTGEVTFGDNYMRTTDGNYKQTYSDFNDLTEYKTLYIDYKKIIGGGGNRTWLAPSEGTSINEGTGLQLTADTSRTTAQLDIQSYSGNYRIVINAYFMIWEIYNIWLE